MSERFFVSQPIENSRALVEGPEAHHLAHVLRAKPGDAVVLFDGSGREFDARIEKISKSAVECIVEHERTVNRESPISLSLAVALPKGDRQRWLVEKTVELGVARIIPLLTERGVAQPVETALARLRRSVIEASKQCGRNTLMEIGEPCRLDALITATKSIPTRLIAHPGGSSILQACSSLAPRAEVVAAIGPEGGFTEAEVGQALASGWMIVSLGPRILRVETAASAVAACFCLGESLEN
jgi:16S rRNA (uracil1498-N3)-methyltransferase